MIDSSAVRFIPVSLKRVTRFHGISCNSKRNIATSHVAMEEPKGSRIDGASYVVVKVWEQETNLLTKGLFILQAREINGNILFMLPTESQRRNQSF